LVSRPHLPKEGPIEAEPAHVSSEAPEDGEYQDGDEAEGSPKKSGSTTSPPPADSEDRGLEKKRKRAGDLASLSTFVPKNSSGEPNGAVMMVPENLLACS
jgi:hypothetical protein